MQIEQSLEKIKFLKNPFFKNLLGILGFVHSFFELMLGSNCQCFKPFNFTKKYLHFVFIVTNRKITSSKHRQ